MPSSTSTRLSTVEKTGLRMQNSNRLMGRLSWRPAQARPGLFSWRPAPALLIGGFLGGRYRLAFYDFDGCSVAQLELAGRDELRVRHHPFHDLDLGAPALSELDLRLHGLAVVDAEHERLPAARHDGAFGRQHHLAGLLALDENAREQPRPQGEIRVRQPRSEGQRTPVDVHLRIDGVDLAGKRLVRLGIDDHVDGLPHIDRWQEQLGQLEIHLEEVDLLQVHDGRADGNESARRYLAQADPTRERRRDDVLGELDALQFVGCARDLEVGRRLVDRLFRHVAGAGELLGAVVVGLGEIVARLGIGDLGLRQGIVQLDQHVARLDRSALDES